MPNRKFNSYVNKCVGFDEAGRYDKLFGMMVHYGLDISRMTPKIWP